MANLQIKGIKDEFYQRIKEMAAAENRSISQQVLFLLKGHLARQKMNQKTRTPAQVLLDLHGSWHDEADADQIIDELKKNRKNSLELSRGF